MLSKRFTAAALVSLGLVLGACGAAEEGGSDPAPSTDEPAASTEPATEEPAAEEAPAQVTFDCTRCDKTKTAAGDAPAPS